MIAAAAGNVERVRQEKYQHLKEEGVYDDVEGFTALMYSAVFNNLQCAKELMEEAGMQNKEGYTALMLAIVYNNK